MRVPDARRARRRLVSLGVPIAVLAIGLGAWSMVPRDADPFPDSIGGIARLTSAQGRTFEQLFDGSSVAGLRVRGTAYGSDSAQLVLFYFVDAPAGLATRSLASLVGTLPAGGTSVDPATAVTRTIDGVEYLCAGGVDGPGASCLFRGTVVGGLTVLTDVTPTRAVDLAREAYDGLDP